MERQTSIVSGEQGFAMVYTAVALTALLLVTGLAVDGGRAYVVKAQLSKAVDGAALAAARNLNSGDPEEEAANIFRANFPAGYLGTSTVTDPTQTENFFDLQTDNSTGTNIVTVRATATLPTTFMSLTGFREVAVEASGEATRRMVDLSLVLDVSSSIGSAWPAVRDAAETFVQGFDPESDRMSLVMFSNGGNVYRPMPGSRGFDLGAMLQAIPTNLPGGSTNMAEGLYRGWDQVRNVPSGQQSGLRVIVLFTDGASNGVPARWGGLNASRTVRTFDFPDQGPNDQGQTWNDPQIAGYANSQSGNAQPTPAWGYAVNYTNQTYTPNDSNANAPRWMPANSFHEYRSSAGIPTSFPLVDNTIRVDGMPQTTARPLLFWSAANNGYRANLQNINNAARNLVEIIAHRARTDDDGDYPIRIYTIGMGHMVKYELGTRPETSESMLMRIANDPDSADFDDDLLPGAYYFAETGADVGPAFQALQNEIIRLTK
jgi:Flp pilus assembly protein TadG